MSVSRRAEAWIMHLAWIGQSDDPSKVASEAAGLLRELLDEHGELLAALKDMTEDLEARWDMRDPRTNPGIRDCVERARTVISRADVAITPSGTEQP